jgi:hypothetical protein
VTIRLRLHRLPRWSRWSVALICPVCAALSYIFRMANGMVVGDLIGLPGREQQITLAQHRASLWLDASVIFETVAALAVFSLLTIGSDSDALPRFLARGMTAVLLSLAVTLLLGTLIVGVLR